MMHTPLSPRTFATRYALIWLLGLGPSGFLAVGFAQEDHPFAPFALGVFLSIALGGAVLRHAAMRALFPQTS
jgi:hypothetical protein